MPIVEGGMLLKGKTDKDGKVSFSGTRLRPDSYANKSTERGDITSRNRLTKFFDLEVVYASGGIQCSTGLFSLDEIIKSGVVDDNHCKTRFDTTKVKAAPGEVIMFVSKYHWWESGQE